MRCSKTISFVCISIIISCFNILYAQDFLRERIYVHSDRNYYHSGETMWFKVYVVDGITHKPVSLSKVAYIELLDSLNKPILQQVVPLNSGTGKGYFELPDVVPGVYRLVSYTNWMKNEGPSAFFNKEVVIVNGEISSAAFLIETDNSYSRVSNDFKIDISSDKPVYGVRERVTLNLAPADTAAHLSIAVYRVDSIVKPDPYRISSYLDTLSSTASRSTVKYVPEVNGRLVSGKVRWNNSRENARNVNVFLTVPGDASGFYNDRSDDDGNLLFEIRNLTGYDSLIIQRERNDDNRVDLEIDDPYFQHGSVVNQFRIDRISVGSPALSEMFINRQVQHVYNAGAIDSAETTTEPTQPFFGKSDMTYQLDDFTRFSKMEEVFREYVAPVAVNKTGAGFSLRVYKPREHATYEMAPLVLIDGYPVVDIDTLFEFDPLKVKTIDIINKRYYYNGALYDGIVSLSTYSRDLNGFPLSGDALIIRNQNIARDREFQTVNYDNEIKRRSRLPDFRNLLFWCHDVRDTNIKFYTSDLEGTFIVIVQGIATSGKSGSASISFQVKK